MAHAPALPVPLPGTPDVPRPRPSTTGGAGRSRLEAAPRPGLQLVHPRRDADGGSGLAELRALLGGRRVLVVASTGGHLAQASKWADILQLHEDSTFVTHECEQAHGLLASRSVIHVPYVPPRGGMSVARAAGQLLREVPRGRYDAILSTGAGIALSALPLAARLGAPMVYIESVSRFVGPSLTGRILERLPQVRRYAQHPTYDRRRWSEVPSLLGDYAVTSRPGTTQGPASADRPLRLLVTLGTIKPYRFDRMVDAVRGCLRPGDEVIWQLGATTRSDLEGQVHDQLQTERFAEAARTCDVVLTHAGVGTILELLDDGKLPIVFARKAALGEHIDDHQEQILGRLLDLGLAHPGDVRLTRAALLAAADSAVTRLAPERALCS